LLALGEGDGTMPTDTFPNFVKIRRRLRHPATPGIRTPPNYQALAEMLAHNGPYLDVIGPYQEHVLPMIPSGKTVRDIIVE
jgi:acetolactate synthase-1/2/3 large subunit